MPFMALAFQSGPLAAAHELCAVYTTISMQSWDRHVEDFIHYQRTMVATACLLKYPAPYSNIAFDHYVYTLLQRFIMVETSANERWATCHVATSLDYRTYVYRL